MTDYKKLSDWEKAKIDKEIIDNVKPGHFINKYNKFEWDEPEYTLKAVHNGFYCAICLRSYYTCLCSHEN